MKIAILGAGNIGMALAQGLVEASICQPQNVFLTRKSAPANQVTTEGFNLTSNNATAIEGAAIIFIAVLPQQLDALLQEIQPICQVNSQLIVSVVTGVSTQVYQQKLSPQVRIIRAMPNTALSVKQSMTCISASNAHAQDIAWVEQLFNSMGVCILIKEELMGAATALGACGIAFFLRTIRAASQGGVEIGFHAHDALKIAVQTALGAATILHQYHTHPEHEIDKVTSPQGCTIAGLNEMEHQGLSSAFIKGIKLSSSIANGLYPDKK
jgi:pyrroline-5-carboxylate reductase